MFSLFSFPDLEILEFYFLYHTEDPDDDDINQIQMEIQVRFNIFEIFEKKNKCVTKIIFPHPSPPGFPRR